MAAKSNTIEESFEQIEDILARLDDGSLSLANQELQFKNRKS